MFENMDGNSVDEKSFKLMVRVIDRKFSCAYESQIEGNNMMHNQKGPTYVRC